MAYPVVFLNPSVLMSAENQVENRFDQPECFDKEALRCLQDLTQRIKNVAIVLILPCTNNHSLDHLQAAYQSCKLGNIIGTITHPPYFDENEGLSVDIWLQTEISQGARFPIQSFAIISGSKMDRYVNRSVFVQDPLSEPEVKKAIDILENQPLDPNEIPAKDRLIYPGHPHHYDVVNE